MKTIPAYPARDLTPTAIDGASDLPRTTVVAAPPAEVYGLPAPIFMPPRPVALQVAPRPIAPKPAPRPVRRRGSWAGKVMWLAVVLVGVGSAGAVLAFSDAPTDPSGDDAPMFAVAPPTVIEPDALPSGATPFVADTRVAAAAPPPRTASRAPAAAPVEPAPSTTPSQPAPSYTPSQPAPSTTPPASTTPATAPSTPYPGGLILPPAASEPRGPSMRMPSQTTPVEAAPVRWTPRERTPVLRPKAPTRVPVLRSRTR